jgi:hypothetical protein
MLKITEILTKQQNNLFIAGIGYGIRITAAHAAGAA